MFFYLSYEGLKITIFPKKALTNLTVNSNLPYHFALQFNPDF